MRRHISQSAGPGFCSIASVTGTNAVRAPCAIGCEPVSSAVAMTTAANIACFMGWHLCTHFGSIARRRPAAMCECTRRRRGHLSHHFVQRGSTLSQYTCGSVESSLPSSALRWLSLQPLTLLWLPRTPYRVVSIEVAGVLR